MRDLNTLGYHPTQEDIVKILSTHTQNSDPGFFRLLTAFYFGLLASMMRTHVFVPGTGRVPINIYAINLAQSGAGKGTSLNMIEDSVVNHFKEIFLLNTFRTVAEVNIEQLAGYRARKMNKNEEEEFNKLKKEFYDCGPLLFSFDSGTTPAIKQMRQKLLLAKMGSMNLIIDEIGSNLLPNQDVLTTYLELFDMGKLKPKLIKQTKENRRGSDMTGATPANLLAFGTPTRLLDDPKVCQEFEEMLKTGYARRCFFGFNTNNNSLQTTTPEELYDLLISGINEQTLETISAHLGMLATAPNHDQTIKMDKSVALQWLEYRQDCDRRADRMSDFEEIRRAELKHRYFKVIKLAGAYAFIDNTVQLTEDHLYYAIRMAEDSGKALNRIKNRERDFVKLANYICSIDRPVTQVDLVQDLPFFKGTQAEKREMLSMAVTHAHHNNMVIKKEMVEEIEFYRGSSLEETNLEQCIISLSKDWTKDYHTKTIRWDELYKLCTAKDWHWVNHHLQPNTYKHQSALGYRDEQSVLPGFNLLVLDVDEGISIDLIKVLLKEYKYFLHTTKRHTPQEHRFRLVLPLSHSLNMDSREYSEFMSNIYRWLPFKVDTQTAQRSRKWETYPGKYLYNDGKSLDALQFIPKTKKAEEQKAQQLKQKDLNQLERWFLNNMKNGNRNHMLLRYAYMLIDMSKTYTEIEKSVLLLNQRNEEPLDESEIRNTILKTVQTKLGVNQP